MGGDPDHGGPGAHLAGDIFPTFYHSDSGGFTEPPQNVFSGERIPPLPGVRDEFSLESPNYSWAVTLPLGVIAERLRQGGLDVGDIRDLAVLERSPSFRVARLRWSTRRGRRRCGARTSGAWSATTS